MDGDKRQKAVHESVAVGEEASAPADENAQPENRMSQITPEQWLLLATRGGSITYFKDRLEIEIHGQKVQQQELF